MYDKSDLIKETFITTLNKKYQFMVPSVISIKKQKMKFLKLYHLRSIENILLTETDTAKNSLSFRLTNINGNIPKLKDKKF